MKINVFDITLVRLKHEHIEELRQQRNSDKIKMRMEYREYITPEMQEDWFKKTNNDIENSLYMIVVYNGKNIGLISGRERDNQSEGGIFFWEDYYMNTHIPVLTSITFIDNSIYFLQHEKFFGKILRDNLPSISYNKSLGFRLCEGQEDKQNQLYMLTREEYEKRAPEIRKMLQRIYHGQEYAITIQLEQEDERNGFADVVRMHNSRYDASRSPVRIVVKEKD